MHVTQNWKGFDGNAGETDERTGVSVALPVIILVSRVRTTAEERDEDLQGAASALYGSHSLGGARNEVIHIDLLAPNFHTPLLSDHGGWFHQPQTEQPQERIVTHILVNIQYLGEAPSF